jgi:hypothetical protein
MRQEVQVMKRLLLLLFLPFVAHAADETREISVTASVILESVCVPAIDGQGYVAINDTVSGLIIEIRGADGTQIALYDAATEIEDVALIGTYSAPSANNIRASSEGSTGADCTQIQVADAVWSGQERVTITITDGQTTIMDWSVKVIIKQPWQ